MSDLFGLAGTELLDRLAAADVRSRSRIESLRRIIDALDFEIDAVHQAGRRPAGTDPGYLAMQAIPGVGPVLAAVFVAEIGDITRFHRPDELACWAGLTPKHHESDTTVHRGRITKQGSRLVRWAAVEAVQRLPAHTRLGQLRDRVADRRGRNIGVVAAARELIDAGVLRPARSPRPLPAHPHGGGVTPPLAPAGGRGSCRS